VATWLHTNVFTESTFLLRGHIFLTSLFNLVATELTDFDSRFFVLNVSSWSGHKQFEPLIHKGAIQVQMLPYGLVNPAIKISLWLQISLLACNPATLELARRKMKGLDNVQKVGGCSRTRAFMCVDSYCVIIVYMCVGASLFVLGLG